MGGVRSRDYQIFWDGWIFLAMGLRPRTREARAWSSAITYLTNRFHVAVRLFSNRSQMTSKCGKNNKVAHEAIAECVTDVLTTF